MRDIFDFEEKRRYGELIYKTAYGESLPFRIYVIRHFDGSDETYYISIPNSNGNGHIEKLSNKCELVKVLGILEIEE